MKFNAPSASARVINQAGGEAFSQSPKLELVSLLLTSFVKDQFYRTESETLDTLKSLIAQIPDKKFVAKAALFARNEYGMRSITHVTAGEIAKQVKGEKWTKNFFNKIVKRPDDMTEILSYYYATNGKKNEPNALKKGFALAINRFNEYQLAKYKQDKAQVSLVDIANLVHPRPTEAIAKLIKGTLETPETWETMISASGSDENKKKEAWTKLITERKIGYFALLRNLRNILEQAPNALPQALEMLADEKLIKSSLVLPFRFTTAYEQIKQTNFDGSRKVLVALNKAIDISTANVPIFDGKTLVVLDCSGSMSGKPAEIGSLFSAILVKSNDADFMTFSDSASYHTLNTMDSTLTIAQSMNFISGGTNFHAIFEEANKAYDRIIILSDMQGWIGYDAPTRSFESYKRRLGANPKIYSFDLQGYGSLQFPEPNIYCMAGFSEKVFDVMKFLETDKQALINIIEKIDL